MVRAALAALVSPPVSTCVTAAPEMVIGVRVPAVGHAVAAAACQKRHDQRSEDGRAPPHLIIIAVCRGSGMTPPAYIFG